LDPVFEKIVTYPINIGVSASASCLSIFGEWLLLEIERSLNYPVIFLETQDFTEKSQG